MNKDAIRRFLMLLSSALKVERGSLYQLVGAVEASYYLRDIASQHEIALALQAFEYPFNQVGKYYESIYLSRSGQNEKARELLECVADSAPARYRSKALLSLAAVAERIGQFEESLRFRLQVSSDDPLIALEAQQSIALLRSIEGEHHGTLRELERLLPLAHIIGKSKHPAYFTFLNSYAVELAETNRTSEAEQIANVIAASPFISRYPEWQETVAEITAKRKRSSLVAVSREVTPQEPRVQAAIAFMHKNLHEKILVLDIARAVGMSKSHFIRVFTDEAGISPGRYLMNLRLRKAGELLATGYMNIQEVMTETGYNTRGDFIRQFKRHYRATPMAYRNRHRRKLHKVKQR